MATRFSLQKRIGKNSSTCTSSTCSIFNVRSKSILSRKAFTNCLTSRCLSFCTRQRNWNSSCAARRIWTSLCWRRWQGTWSHCIQSTNSLNGSGTSCWTISLTINESSFSLSQRAQTELRSPDSKISSSSSVSRVTRKRIWISCQLLTLVSTSCYFLSTRPKKSWKLNWHRLSKTAKASVWSDLIQICTHYWNR